VSRLKDHLEDFQDPSWMNREPLHLGLPLSRQDDPSRDWTQVIPQRMGAGHDPRSRLEWKRLALTRMSNILFFDAEDPFEGYDPKNLGERINLMSETITYVYVSVKTCSIFFRKITNV
jgi:hypothetical protein